ncbi:YhgE/Pip domain-containing protein [Rossellomorea vietnamensis]|uniref:YhgE/Pip domain-containing protein n=1 Tax=Rossellomorea vietnamensis TaxID=218284 RepID=UPI001E2C55C5|nr:YhgE/Pip domain-containing protein [Rossellomorea vietnamensis]MCC5800946.1 YhgE/Pip domain-containing protein [Rossellomorea vietnamensis]
MKGFALILQDLKAMLSHKHRRIALGFLLLVPLIYSGLFLSGYWNPYGKLEQLPVAIVNEDEGAVMEDEPIEAGKDFVKELKESEDLNFKFVSTAKAKEGLKEGAYYMIVTIPEDFSKKVSTLMDEHPEPAELLYMDNPGKNFVASQISSSATEKMKSKLSDTISKSYADGVFSKFEEVGKGLTKASDGASRLHNGIADEKAGMDTLAAGINGLGEGSEKLQAGSEKLSTGAGSLESSLQHLHSSSVQLAGGMKSLSQAGEKMNMGTEQLADQTKKLAGAESQLQQQQSEANDTAEKLESQLQTYQESHPEAKNDREFKRIQELSEKLTASTSELENGQSKLHQQSEQLAGGQSQLHAGFSRFTDKLNQASDGASELATGSKALSSGFTDWNKGFTTLTAGIDSLSTGSEKLSSGVSALNQGLTELESGSGELSTKLADAAEKTSEVHSTEELSSMFSDPVHLVKSNVSKVPNYGTGIAPYFLSLALYVGGIMAANILPLGRRNDLHVNGTTHFINKWGLVFAIGSIQALIVDGVLLFGFHLEVVNVPLFILSSIIVSFTFMTFIFMLITVFGFVGKFLAVTFLVLQLATCGGTFPRDLNSPILRIIGENLPMAHSLSSFQEVITLGDFTQLAHQLWILFAYLAVAGGIAWFTTHMQHSKTAEAVK